MKQKFLCPVDFSTAANNAVEYSARLAKELNAGLVLLQILQVPSLQDVSNMGGGFVQEFSNKENEAKEKLYAYTLMIEEKFKIKCNYEVKLHNSAIDLAIKKEIQENNYNLIIMGTNGADSLKQFYFGTHTYKAMKNCNIPLLMIPEDIAFKKFKKIVYATDCHINQDLKALKKLIKLTKQYKPGIDILHISKKPTETKEEIYRCFKNLLEDEIDNKNIHFKHIINQDIAESIHQYMNNKDVDLLVLLTKNYTLFEKIFHESITKKLSFIANFPILSYKIISDTD